MKKIITLLLHRAIISMKEIINIDIFIILFDLTLRIINADNIITHHY
ncbi:MULTISPECIES: hypothetical protein [unclassified Wolbachia]|nr:MULTISPECIES: hypothetical protein [unclassified Wolbachia]